MPGKEPFYITTPIYYPSNNLHIGNSYTTVAADAMARFQKLVGKDVYFLTGTDEHGQKLERRAAEAGMNPIAFIDNIVEGIQSLWKLMDIDYDDFIRTTEPRHEKIVKQIFQKLYDQGDIYKAAYEGLYCTPCEAHWTETQAKDGLCPDCGRPVEKIVEESYFFRMAKYADWLIQYIEEHPDFIQPPSRANEMLGNFLRPGLTDLCVSRTTFKWGIPVPFDPEHVIYVWIDALTNYITALGYGTDDDSKFRRYWPASVQLVGKDIIRFHTIYWPIMLHALGLPMPGQVFAHGWLVFGGEKMSKSKGNVVDPVVLCNRYTSDAIRYFLLREMPLGADGNFTNEGLLTRLNADLANDLGNLLSRTVAMIEKYFDGFVPTPDVITPLEGALIETALALPSKVQAHMDALLFSQALQEIWKLIGDCNRYIDQTAPWILAKNEADRPRLGTVMFHLAECLRIVAILVGPIMPRTPERIFVQLGIDNPDLTTWDSLRPFGMLPPGTHVAKGDALFPRYDIAKEMETLTAPKVAPVAIPQKPEKPTIVMDDFDKIALKVARVIACEKVEKADKLLKLTLSLGTETRTVLSGIAKHYTPEEMVGKSVVLLSNLAPRTMRGIESQGMVLAAGEGDVLRLVTVDGDIEDGATIS